MTDATAAHSYRPGPWFAVLGEHVTVLLPPSEKGRVAAIWGLVDDGAGFDVALDALISEGLRDLPGFVLVSAAGGGTDDTKVVVRGEARAWFATADGEVDVEGSGMTTWAERSLVGVTASRLVVGEAPADGPAHAIDTGLVRVSEVSTPADVPSHAPVAAAAPLEPEPAATDVSDTAPQPAAGDTAPPGPVGPEPGTPEPPEPQEPFAGPPSGPPPPVGDAPWVTPTGDHDGMTRAGPPPSPAAGTPGEPEPPSTAGRPVARLVFSHGDEVDVDRTVLVGRPPEARRFTSGDQPRLVTVPSPAQEISSTHLEVRPGSGADHGSAVITDLGSTNGTVLVQPGLAPEELRPGIAVQLIPGAIVDLGDGVTIQVINP